MNNKDFIQALSRSTDFSPKETEKLVNSFVQAMAEKLDDQTTYTVMGFGTFEVKKKMERIVVNPANKKRKLIPPKLVLTFKAGNNLKEKLKNNSAE